MRKSTLMKTTATTAAIFALIGAAPAFAEVETETAYVLNTFSFLINGALVMWMAAGFAMLESGLVRSKNTATICLKNIALYAIAGITFYLVGYNLMYMDVSGFIGSFSPFWSPDDAEALAGTFASDGYSASSDWFFQMVFVATAASIVSGTLAERTKLWSFLAFVVLLTLIIYPIQGSWTWGGGWLSEMGFSDYAGSTIVHSVGGWAALTGAIILGARKGKYTADGRVNPIPGANLPLATLGTFVLWLGWFGFNGGSTLSASQDVGTVLMNTQIAAVLGVIGTIMCAGLLRRTMSAVTILNGGLAGLVAITAGCASMSAGFSALTGLIGGFVMVISGIALEKLRIDDVVGAIPVHGFAGAWGTLAAGMFYSGDLFNVSRISIQLLGIGAVFVWSFSAALILFGALKMIIGIRASTLHEQHGLDYTEHADVGYPEFQASLAPRS